MQYASPLHANIVPVHVRNTQTRETNVTEHVVLLRRERQFVTALLHQHQRQLTDTISAVSFRRSSHSVVSSLLVHQSASQTHQFNLTLRLSNQFVLISLQSRFLVLIIRTDRSPLSKMKRHFRHRNVALTLRNLVRLTKTSRRKLSEELRDLEIAESHISELRNVLIRGLSNRSLHGIENLSDGAIRILFQIIQIEIVPKSGQSQSPAMQAPKCFSPM